MPKRFLHIAFVFLLLSACGRHHVYSPSLLRADSLCSVRPDSALALLQQLSSQMPTAPEPDRMFHQLLFIKAADKADRPITQCDTTILRLIDYYENGGDPAKLAETYYYAGRIHFEKQDAPKALDYYLRAMDHIGLCDDSVRVKSVLLSQIGYIYHYQEIDSVARIWFEKACDYAIVHHDTLSLIFGLRDRANTYTNYEESRKREDDLNKALLLCEKTSNRVMANVVKSQIANLYIDEGRFVEAKELLMPIKDELTSIGKSAVYSMCAKIYYGIGLQDSAKYYSKILLQEGTLYTKESSSKRLAEIALKESRPQQAIEYLSINKALNDTLKLLQAKESIARANAAYNYQKHEKENNLLKIENSRHYLIMVIAIALLVVSLLSIISIVLDHRRKETVNKTKLDRLNKSLERQKLQSSNYISENIIKIRELEQQMQLLDEKNEDLIRQLRIEQERLKEANQMSTFEIQNMERRSSAMSDFPIYKTVITKANASKVYNKTLSEEEWEELDKSVNDVYESFSSILTEHCKMSKHEYNVCLLLKIGLSPADISRLTNRSQQAINSTRSRLYFKYFGKKGSASEWDDFIKSI